jgi:RimJ/RimL family protein N-acetyltransferase
LSGEVHVPSLTVREMRLADVGIRIDYFHDASDGYLQTLGVDRALLPSREEWYAFYEEDYARPIHLRAHYSLVWELDGQPVGFGSTDQITFGEEARMHLHIVRPTRRREGLGHEFVKQSVPVYFEVLRLQRLACEPNAFNVAPNRTVQRVGFRYQLTHRTTPGPINFPQATTRWVLQRSEVPGLEGTGR